MKALTWMLAVWPGLLAAQGWETGDIAGMEVHLYLPASTGAIGDGRSLLIVLHGCTQPNEALRDGGNFEGPAEEYGMVVAIPDVPDGGVVAGCWDYYGAVHTRSTKHNGNLIELAEALSQDPAYGIDPDQVYITGLSSGGGQVAVIGCLAPDIFAGLAIVSGPAAGTSLMEFASKPAGLGPEEVAATCTDLAGPYSAEFSTQLTSIFQPSQDPVVDPDYAEVNARAYAQLYTGSGTLTESPFAVEQLPGSSPQGDGTQWCNDAGCRVSMIIIPGSHHGWPAGSGIAGGSFIISDGVHYAAYLARFFSENNPRLGSRPVVEFTSTTVQECCVDIAGTARDPDGHQLSSLTIELDGIETELSAGTNGSWSHTQCDLSPGNHSPVVTATNDRGARTVKQGEEFTIDGCGNLAPQVVIVDISTGEDCVSLTGTANDPDGDFLSTTIAFDDEPASTLPLIPGGVWDHQRCGMSEGSHTAKVSAVDPDGLEDSADARFEIAPPGAPSVSMKEPVVNGDCVNLEGTATDPEGQSLTAVVRIDTGIPAEVSLAPDGTWTHQFCSLEPGSHAATLTATDPTGLSATVERTFVIRSTDENQPPQVSIDDLEVDGDCVNLDGTATDPDGDSLSLVATIDQTRSDIDPPDALGRWSHSRCGLEEGEYRLQVSATDPGGLQASDWSDFSISAGKSGGGGCFVSGENNGQFCWPIGLLLIVIFVIRRTRA